MASTSNKNYSGNYVMEQKINNRIHDFTTYIHSSAGQAITGHHPGDGLLPAGTGRAHLCSNYTDVESNLKGIGSTNLVKPLTPVNPDFQHVQSLNVMDRVPLYVPAPFQAKTHQRPAPLN